jgi:hypothetical protein
MASIPPPDDPLPLAPLLLASPGPEDDPSSEADWALELGSKRSKFSPQAAAKEPATKTRSAPRTN